MLPCLWIRAGNYILSPQPLFLTGTDTLVEYPACRRCIYKNLFTPAKQTTYGWRKEFVKFNERCFVRFVDIAIIIAVVDITRCEDYIVPHPGC